jgi:hypothetical protein
LSNSALSAKALEFKTGGVNTSEGVINVKAASRLLGIVAPLTLEELLEEGNAAGLSRLIVAAIQPKAIAVWLDEQTMKCGRLFTDFRPR